MLPHRSSDSGKLPTVEEDPRFRQCRKEMCVVMVYWMLLLPVLLGVAQYMGGSTQARDVSFIFVWPDWFFWSQAVVALFAAAPWFIIRAFFQNMSLDSAHDCEREED